MSKKRPDLLPRRRAIQVLGSAAGAAAFGCSDDEVAPQGTGGEGGAAGSTTTGAGVTTGSSSSTTSGMGGAGGEGGAGGGAPGACDDDPSLTAADLLAPIDTIVVLMMENRSFDHYFGALQLLEGRTDIEGLSGGESNPQPGGGAVGVFQLNDFTVVDPPHEWDACHEQWNNGMNDGFVIAHAGPNQADVMGYHIREHIPILYALSDSYALCDQWFASVMGPTWPNRLYLHGATSNGNKSNVPTFGFESIFDLLEDAGLSHKNYYSDLPWCSGAYFKLGGLATIESFFEDAAAGTLPNFCIIDPTFAGSGANDDHPDHDIQLGQALIASVYAALAQSTQWSRCLLVITYDEHGGFFDHVPPPTVTDDDEDFRQLGFRVPSLVIGPHVKKGCAISTTLEHVSVIKTVAERFGLPMLNQRMAEANGLSSAISPAFLRNPQAPVTLPQLEISLASLERPAPPVYHREMWEAADRGIIPKHLDRRAQSAQITRRVLEHGARLGAIRLR
ncbi:MAG: alkaline phosphatase family protein [Myxococcales bacterium]|nr:alkaline phosphatase family protein [Myxococcales bacterium]